MKKIISFIFCFLMVFAFASEITGKDITQEHLNMFKQEYNKNINQVPEIAINLFGNEKMNLYVKDYENKPIFIIMEKGNMENIGFGELKDKTMNVYTDEDTIKKIANNEITFAEALQYNKIRYEGIGIINSIKTGIANIGITIWSWFVK
ncbi:MAG: hypothetical protein WC356_00135 [Candidatus Micrarchaeia archaeon]